MTTIVSPHLDDAVLSLGQAMSVKQCRVVTVFTGSPDNPDYCSDYDRARGFANSRTAMLYRQLEDRKACDILNAEAVHLGFLDRQYEPTHDESAITNAIAEELEEFSLIPLGLGHPDHETVSRCCLSAGALRKPCTLFVYEELPYRVIGAEKVPAALDRIRQRGWAMARYPLQPPFEGEPGDRNHKERALTAYASQLDLPLDPCFLVPERAWRITKW